MNTWEKQDDSLVQDFTFNDFQQALAFVNQVGVLAEVANHHPEIRLHDYKQVKISLSTHDAGGVTQKDYDLANQIDQL